MHTYIHKKSPISGVLLQFDAKKIIYNLPIDVLNRTSVVIKGIGSNANQSGWQFLESIWGASLEKLREPSVRVVG